MTTTVTPQPAVPATVPGRWHKHPLIRTAGLILTAGILGAIAAATFSGPGASAASTLQSDGYTLACNLTPAQTSATFGSAAPYITSAAAGADSQGDAEVVVYLTSQGMARLSTGAARDSETVGGYFTQGMPGTVTTVSGDILRISFPASVVAASDGIGCPA